MKRLDIFRPVVVAGASCGLAAVALAEPKTYEIDSDHTYPSFEADHMGGLSNWRGKINSTSGTLTLDQEAETGNIDVTMDMTSIDFGHDDLNEHAQTADMFDVAEHPTATYTGELVDWEDGEPAAVDGMLTLTGETRPVRLDIDSFTCQPHPQEGREVCGADAMAEIDRSDFGVDFGQDFGFDMGVVLRIQAEALALPE